MEYRITVRSNPRIIIIFLIIVGLPAFGIASFFFLSPVLAIAATVVGGFFSYSFLKLVRSILASRIVVKETSISFDFGKGHVDEFLWNEVTHAGLYTETSGERSIFVYNEADDRLVTVPAEYAGFDELVEEVRAPLADRFETIDIAAKSTIHEYLRSKIAPPEEADENDEDSFDQEDEDS